MTLSGIETVAKVRESQSETLLAFSRGKDSIAAWLAIRESFEKVHPYYMYRIPGLEFVDESLAYYEQFFGVKIHQMPHPALHRWLNNFTFQPPERVQVIRQADLPTHSYDDVRQAVAKMHGLHEDTLMADGIRAADSPIRRVAIMKHGSISWSKHLYHPVWDMTIDPMLDLLKRHGLKLPVDYTLFGRSFDGLDLRFLLPLKKHRPGDYRKVLEWFPLADLEVFRWECANGNK